MDVLEEGWLRFEVQRAVLAVLERLPAHWTDPYTRALLKAYKAGMQHNCNEEYEDKEEDRC